MNYNELLRRTVEEARRTYVQDEINGDNWTEVVLRVSAMLLQHTSEQERSEAVRVSARGIYVGDVIDNFLKQRSEGIRQL